MKPHVTLITLGVDDLDRSMAFYRDGLGLATRGIVGEGDGEVVFFTLQPSLWLALFRRESLAADAGLPVGPKSSTEFTLAHNVSSPEEVGAVMEEARAAGARIVKEAQDTFWGGHHGIFEDPDGHLWEVAWNPQMPPPDYA